MNVEFHHEATSEVRAAIAFYEAERGGLGRDLWNEIQATLQRIEPNPEGPEYVGPKLHRAEVASGVRQSLPLQRDLWHSR